MEEFPWFELLEDNLPLYASIAVAALLGAFLSYQFWKDPEAAIDFSTPEPAQIHPDWKGETLENPSIKVFLALALT
jgi:hypothetical protein